MGSELNLETTESSWTGGWFSWTRQSDAMLRHVEKKILSCLKTAYKRFYVDIGSVVGQSDKIWTVSLNDESSRTPLVMLHGMGAGLALWCPNFDALAETRPVYAIDLLGFGRSSRPKFATEALKAEAQWVESVEEWRREVNLPQFILLGHSLGGYIATSYAMKYPESGESAFHSLMTGFGWAKNPMVKRIDKLSPALPITVLYGSRSWVDNSTGHVLSEHRPHSRTYVQVINGAGHHVYLDKPELFNKYVLEACSRADEYDPRTSTVVGGDTNKTEEHNS